MEQGSKNVSDVEGVTSISDLDHPLSLALSEALDEARGFIQFYTWVSSIKAEFLGFGVEGIIYVFLFEIIPARPEVDRLIWVIVGDVPPAYIGRSEAKNPYEAVNTYVGAMEKWVSAAQAGKSVANLIPVNVAANPANAAMLDRRLKFIEERILPSLKQ